MQKIYTAFLALIAIVSSVSVNAQIVISQVYGGGGNSGATYKNDFIELFNKSNAPVSLAGWSVQYASATGSSWGVTNLTNFTLQPGQYYLIQQAQGSGGTVDLPTPDATGNLAMAAGAGKVALVNSTTALSGTCPTTGVIDFVGFGTTANCFEGAGPTPTLSNTTAALRLNNGCTDTNNNAADFATGAPNPRNSSTSSYSCSSPSYTVSVTAGNNAAEPATNGTFIINLSHPAPEGGVTIDYSLTGLASLNIDYTDPQNGTLTIEEGSDKGTILINVIDDNEYEGTETIIIKLISASNGYILNTSSAKIDLLDNELPPVTSAKVVINEVYGGGGNSGAIWKNDFIELYNNEDYAVNLSGWSVQYASAAGTSWAVTNLSGSIPAKGYYLIQQAGTTSTSFSSLPTPDATGTISMSATAGKVALVNNTTALTGDCSELIFVDLVGYSSTASCFEGSGPTATLSANTSAQRKIKGFDTNDNKEDFEAITPPTPRNSVADITPPVVVSTYPENNATGLTSSFTASLNFSENISKGSGNIVLKNADGSFINSFDVTGSEVRINGSSVNFNLQALPYNSVLHIEITPGAFIDASDNEFAGISDATTWSFSTSSVPPVGSIDYTHNFNVCSTNLPDGFTQYSEEGSVIWGCTTFGRDANNPPSGSTPNALQINGFINGANQLNTDWLISPAFDLSNTNYPILSFWSRNAFTGSPLRLVVSTDYTGSGDPNLATWTELNGKFPGTASDVWTLSEDINLTKYKGSSVYIAFIYSSSTDDGARWTLDDITVRNDNNPPAPSLTVLASDVQFIYVKGGETAVKEISFAANDLVEDILVTATANFFVSKDGENFASSVTYNVVEANDIFSKLYIQFAPGAENENYSGTVNLSTSQAIATVNLRGSSIDPAITLEVVNWNIEWFGSTVNGPRNEELQEQNVVKIMKEVNADVYGLMEIVDEAKLARVVNQLEGYAYTISDFGSHVNPFSGTNSTLAEAQKLAFVYKTSVVSVKEVRPMLSYELNTQADAKDNPSFYNWSSGRYPYLMDADVTLGGKTKNIKFVLVHAKANTAPLDKSYERRKAGADALHDSLKILWPEQEIIVFGDFNDDLDVSITTNYTTTSWNKFTEDGEEYNALTLPLSLAGKKSTVSYNDIIDHVVVSNEMSRWYMNSTASILTDVNSLVSNYGGTTSDHYPVFSRYIYCSITAPENIVVSNDEGQCGAVVNYSFTSTQTCGTVTADIESGSFFEVGFHTVTLTSSYGDVATFTVTVNDTEKPTILAPAAITVSPNASGCSAINVALGTPGTSDNCGVSDITNNAPISFPLGTTVVTWTVTDESGNTATATQNVVVRVDPALTSTIPDAFAISPGGAANTVYIGYSPASSITLHAEVSGGTAPYNYKWSIGSSSGRGFSNASSVTVSPATSSTYYLNVEDVYGCVTGATTKTVNVVDVRCGPKLDKVSVCQLNKGKWTTSCVLSKDVPALLASGATLGSCSNTNSVVTVTEPLYEQTIKGLSVLAMPNPSSAYFNLRIQSDNTGERILVRITDILGRTIEQFQNVPSTHVLRIGDNYKNGVYMVEVIQGSSKKHLKIIKNQ
jgi:hypothetical protein